MFLLDDSNHYTNHKDVWHDYQKALKAKVISQSRFLDDTIALERQHRNWKIRLEVDYRTLDKRHPPFTRMRCRYKILDDFVFRIYEEGWLGIIGKVLGAQDLTIGNAKFDEKFIIKSNHHKIQDILTNSSVKTSLLSISQQANFQFRIVDNSGIFMDGLPDGVHELYMEMDEIILNFKTIKTMFELFIDVMDLLEKLGTAVDEKIEF